MVYNRGNLNAQTVIYRAVHYGEELDNFQFHEEIEYSGNFEFDSEVVQ